MTAVSKSFVRSVDRKLGPGRETLRISRVREEGTDGEDVFIFAVGFTADGGIGFHRPGWLDGVIRIPASVVPQVRTALDALEAEGG